MHRDLGEGGYDFLLTNSGMLTTGISQVTAIAPHPYRQPPKLRAMR